MLELNKK